MTEQEWYKALLADAEARALGEHVARTLREAGADDYLGAAASAGSNP